MVSSGGPAALRGHRLQSLYALYRILEADDAEEHSCYRLEGTEDVEILDGVSHDVMEYVQVKAYSQPLTLSHLSRSKENKDKKTASTKQEMFTSSVLRRAADRLRAGQGKTQKVVSIGTIGPELRKAWAGDERARASIRKKLEDRFSGSEIDSLLTHVVLEESNEQQLEDSVFQRLKDGMWGGDPTTTFELLSYWMHLRSEAEAVISRNDVLTRASAVGKYLADRATHHREWFTSILPLISHELPSDSQVDDFRREFYLGVSARFEHIAAGVDAVRLGQLESIASAFAEDSIVVVHGPSGQGKSALAYRFLHDHVPEPLRFEVRTIEDLRHAQSISQAFLGHADAIGVPMYVYLDVQPRDTSWMEIVDRLSRNRGVRVLVTVREEDWTRAGTLRYRVSYTEIELSLDRDEARNIYDQLVARKVPSRVLGFDDAWRRFRPPGPLLEFVFLVVQDATLKARLEEQVRVLEAELTPAELDFLRIASVATAYGADLKLRDAAESVGLDKPSQTLRRLEREYLLRSTPDGRLVVALHAIRSEFLADLLTDPALIPRDEVARRVIRLLSEHGIEIFGLHLLSHHWDTAEATARELLALKPETWTGIAAVLRVLLWHAVRQHFANNAPLVEEAYKEFGDGSTTLLAWDVAGLLTKYPDLNVKFEEMEFVPEDTRDKIAGFRKRITSNQIGFDLPKDWLSIDHSPVPAVTPSDWSGVACLTFWAGYWECNDDQCPWIARVQLGSSFEELALQEAAEVLFGLSFVDSEELKQETAPIRDRIRQLFREQMKVVALEDDGQVIRAHFFLGQDEPANTAGGVKDESSEKTVDLHAEAIRRIDLLRRLYPDRSGYGCKGYGHTLPGLELPYDPTYKEGVPPHYLLPTWPLVLNSVFRHLAEYDHRPDDWTDYAARILAIRRENLRRLEEIRQAVGKHFRSKTPLNLIENEIDSAAWESFRNILRNSPRLPKVAVDQWGFVGEGSSEQVDPTDESRIEEPLAIWRYKEYLDSIQRFVSPLSNFFDQSTVVLAANPFLGRARSDKERRRIRQAFRGIDIGSARRLSVHNLLEAVGTLGEFQTQCRRQLGALFKADELADLEEREQREIEQAWAVWCLFASFPNRRHTDMDRRAVTQFEEARSKKQERLRQRFGSMRKHEVEASVLSESEEWNGEPSLWISLDVMNPLDLDAAIELALDAVDRSLRPGNSALHQAVLSLHWRNVVLVPLVRGRSIDRTAYRIASVHLLAGRPLTEINWWNLAPHPIPQLSFDRLRLRSWQQSSHVEPAERLHGRIVELYSRLAYLQFINDLPAFDEPGEAILQDLVEGQGKALSSTLNQINDAIKTIGDVFLELTNEEKAKRIYLVEALGCLDDIWKSILPRDDMQRNFTLNQHDLAKWYERLANNMGQVRTMRLLFFADVIEQDTEQPPSLE